MAIEYWMFWMDSINNNEYVNIYQIRWECQTYSYVIWCECANIFYKMAKFALLFLEFRSTQRKDNEESPKLIIIFQITHHFYRHNRIKQTEISFSPFILCILSQYIYLNYTFISCNPFHLHFDQYHIKRI